MSRYKKPNPKIWTGRNSNHELYLHEKVSFIDMTKNTIPENAIALLGYKCDEGVRRNQGRLGAVNGPDAIRKAFSKMPNHLTENVKIFDVGNIICTDDTMEATQNEVAEKVAELLHKKSFPVLLGGGHDIAYGHYKGLKKHFGTSKNIGIINFDAHFDLRSDKNGTNSGTPFFQIRQECIAEKSAFNYLALGIRKDANDRVLFKTAVEFGVNYIENKNFTLHHLTHIEQVLHQFIGQVDVVYVTIDLDGFSSAFAHGVSAASPMGFSPQIVFKCLNYLIASKKLVSFDIAEMNPSYDIDNQTAKLAASLLHYIVHEC